MKFNLPIYCEKEFTTTLDSYVKESGITDVGLIMLYEDYALGMVTIEIEKQLAEQMPGKHIDGLWDIAIRAHRANAN
jgi:hypothetical protein